MPLNDRLMRNNWCSVEKQFWFQILFCKMLRIYAAPTNKKLFVGTVHMNKLLLQAQLKELSFDTGRLHFLS